MELHSDHMVYKINIVKLLFCREKNKLPPQTLISAIVSTFKSVQTLSRVYLPLLVSVWDVLLG